MDMLLAVTHVAVAKPWSRQAALGEQVGIAPVSRAEIDAVCYSTSGDTLTAQTAVATA